MESKLVTRKSGKQFVRINLDLVEAAAVLADYQRAGGVIPPIAIVAAEVWRRRPERFYLDTLVELINIGLDRPANDLVGEDRA